MRVPVYQRQLDPTSPGRMPVVPDAGAIGAGIARVGRELTEATDRMVDVAERRREADRTITALTTTSAAMRELDELAAAYDQDPDYVNAEEGFRTDAAKVAEAYVGRFGDDHVRAAQFTQSIERLSTAGALKLRQRAIGKRNDAGVASLDDITARAKLAITNGNRVERDEAMRLVEDGINHMVGAGVITAEDGGKRWRAFTSDVDEADVLQAIRVDPRQALLDLQDPGQYPGLTPIARERQLKAVQSRVDSLDAERERGQARAERDAEKRLRAQGEAAAKEMYGRANDGTLDRAWLDANRDTLSPGEYRTGLEMLNRRGEVADDPEVVMEIEARIDREDVAPWIHRAAKERLISTGTAQKLLDKNRSLRGDDRPNSPYKSGREYIKGVLGSEGTTFNEPAIAGQVKKRLADALDEFDVWMQAHPNATPEEVRDFYRGLADRSQALTLDQVELSLVVPRFVSRPRVEITADALDEAERRVLAELDAGRLGKSEASLELGRIADWRRVVAGRPRGSGQGPARGQAAPSTTGASK
jgi:hypothetical protein